MDGEDIHNCAAPGTRRRFTVLVPALPKIVSYGEDEKEALAMAKEAIELCLIHRTELGEDIPDSDPGSGGVVVHSVSVSVAA